jgi:hypothetical protein
MQWVRDRGAERGYVQALCGLSFGGANNTLLQSTYTDSRPGFLLQLRVSKGRLAVSQTAYGTFGKPEIHLTLTSVVCRSHLKEKRGIRTFGGKLPKKKGGDKK